jgi:hypothetical protein
MFWKSEPTLNYNLAKIKINRTSLIPYNMKKIVYLVLIAFSTSLIVTSCTEEQISPKLETDSGSAGGGNTITGKL